MKALLDEIHPGEILLEDFMKPMGITARKLAADLDVPPSRVSEIVNGHRPITADTALRLGLLAPLRARAYHQFVALPLFQDMAPWNIVFLGGRLDYIDYDTRDRTYDAVVPRAYEVMEVLFNYKRTVEDFKRCNGKAGNRERRVPHERPERGP
jgi:addiction module HigA family antidote